MKKFVNIFFGMIFILAGFAFGGFSTLAVESEPQISAASAIVIDSTTGRTLYEKNAHSSHFPASTTKILTALIAIESGHKMNEKVTVSSEAASTEGSSIYMTEGEIISFEDLLYALMLRSGNDSAVALAEHIAGSTSEFADMMNKKAAELGAEGTNFVTVNGLHDDMHYTTAHDMAIFAREAMKNSTFRKIVSTKEWNASREVDKLNYFINKNKVLYQYEGGNGVKTGYTTVAGRCLVASSCRNGMETICVVFEAPDWFNDCYKLMDYVYDNYEPYTVIEKNKPVAAIRVTDGEKNRTQLVSDRSIIIPKKKNEEINVSFSIDCEDRVDAPVIRGEKAGGIRLIFEDSETYESCICFREDIDVDESAIFSDIIENISKLLTDYLSKHIMK